MFKFLSKKRAQSSLEYAILIIIVLGALLSIQVYIKRGIQGRLRSATDDIGEQYSTGRMNITKITTFRSTTNEWAQGGDQGTNIIGQEITNVDLSSNIVNVTQDYWGSNP